MRTQMLNRYPLNLHSPVQTLQRGSRRKGEGTASYSTVQHRTVQYSTVQICTVRAPMSAVLPFLYCAWADLAVELGVLGTPFPAVKLPELLRLQTPAMSARESERVRKTALLHYHWLHPH